MRRFLAIIERVEVGEVEVTVSDDVLAGFTSEEAIRRHVEEVAKADREPDNWTVEETTTLQIMEEG